MCVSTFLLIFWKLKLEFRSIKKTHEIKKLQIPEKTGKRLAVLCEPVINNIISYVRCGKNLSL